MEALTKIMEGLTALARAGEAQQKAISLLSSTVHSHAKHIKTLEDRIETLESKLYEAGVLKK